MSTHERVPLVTMTGNGKLTLSFRSKRTLQPVDTPNLDASIQIRCEVVLATEDGNSAQVSIQSWSKAGQMSQEVDESQRFVLIKPWA